MDFIHKKAQGLPDTYIDISSPLYFEQREGVLDAEIAILAKLAFNVHVEHPHGFLLNYLSSLGLSSKKEFCQKALNYLNDRYDNLILVTVLLLVAFINHQ